MNTIPENKTTCPLCNSKKTSFYLEDKFRQYFQCNICKLIYVSPEYYLSPTEEKERYDLHENNPTDIHYRKFLNRLFLPITKKIPSNAKGLDFGSGPGPTLSVMFEEAGYQMNIYDLFYANDKSVLKEKYDFITTTEVLEHLHNPEKEIQLLWSILKSNGYLGIMTKLVTNKEAFSKWHYKTDATHVCFFSKETFLWLADKFNAKIQFIHDDVILLKK